MPLHRPPFMFTPAPHSALAAIQDNSPDVLMGHLALYTVVQGNYHREKLEERLQQMGLPLNFLPSSDRAVNAFKKATSAVNVTYTFDGNPARLVMHTTMDTSQVLKRVYSRVAAGTRKVTHAEVLEAAFYRPTERNSVRTPGSHRMNVRLLSGVAPHEKAHLEQVRLQIQSDFELHTHEGIDESKVRNCVRDLLAWMHGVQVRNGCYFVPLQMVGELQTLQRAFDVLPECTFHLVPVPRLDEQRSMVSVAYNESMVQAFTTLRADVHRQTKSRRAITESLFARVSADFDRLVARGDIYHRLEVRSFDSVRQAAKACEEEIRRLKQRLLLELENE